MTQKRFCKLLSGYPICLYALVILFQCLLGNHFIQNMKLNILMLKQLQNDNLAPPAGQMLLCSYTLG